MTSPSASRPPSRWHPIVLLVLVPLVARGMSLVIRFFDSDAAGRPTVTSPLTSLFVAVPYHVLALAPLPALWLLLWNVMPRRRALVARLLALLVPIAVAIGEADRQMLRFLGYGLTLSALRTYGVTSLVSGEVLRPLLAGRLQFLLSLALIAVSAVAGQYLARRAVRTSGGRRANWISIGALAAAPLALTVGPLQVWRNAPPEIVLARSLAGLDATSAPPDEAQAVRELRDLVEAPPGTVWLDPAFPLLRQEPVIPRVAAPAPVADRPDIVVVVVESLRGRDTGFASGRQPSVTPALDALAARGVAVPHLVANSVFSAGAFMTLHTSWWTHRSRLLTAEFPGIRADAFPTRLRRLGYEATFVSGSNPSFDNMLVWQQRWYDRLIFDLPANRWIYTRRMGDAMLIEQAISEIDRHDRATSERPLLLVASTSGMHSPFTLEDSYFVPLSAAGDANRVDTGGIADPQQRYDMVVANFDRQLGRLIARLATRPRSNRTVLIVVGDHSYFTNESIPEPLMAMPVDPIVWTVAVISGPQDLVGPPRRVEGVRSHVDLMPTILRLAGDDGPIAGIGRDLVAEARVSTSIAIRPGGIRVDRGGMAALFVPGAPEQAWTFAPFTRGATSFRSSLQNTPFTAQELAKIDRSVRFWSYLLEQDRAWKGGAR